jgi:hypothetical protein
MPKGKYAKHRLQTSSVLVGAISSLAETQVVRTRQSKRNPNQAAAFQANRRASAVFDINMIQVIPFVF